MLHPSYTELIKVVNSEVEDGDTSCSKQPVFHRSCNCQESTSDY